MDKGSTPVTPTQNVKRPGRGKVTPRVSVEETVINVEIPPGSRFKGHQSFQEQDLVISVRATRYRRERWVTPDGRTILAPLPEGIDGHFGPTRASLRADASTTRGSRRCPGCWPCYARWGLRFRSDSWFLVVEREPPGVHRRSAECSARGAKATSPWVSADDTGASCRQERGFCTQIGNDVHMVRTRSSKSRLNFLDLLRAGHTDYVLNDAAYDYMRNQGLPAATIARLKAGPETRFATRTARQAHLLDRLGFNALKVTPEPVRVATEGALWGSVQAHEFLCDAVVLSDDAGQFNIGQHALCWVHAERLVHKLEAFTDQHRAAQTRVRSLIWDFYATSRLIN